MSKKLLQLKEKYYTIEVDSTLIIGKKYSALLKKFSQELNFKK